MRLRHTLLIVLLLCITSIVNAQGKIYTHNTQDWDYVCACQASLIKIQQAYTGQSEAIPCDIHVTIQESRTPVGDTGGGGTAFTYGRRGINSCRVTVNGTKQQIIDYVIPHEMAHVVFNHHVGGPLPRWLDEGAACNEEKDGRYRDGNFSVVSLAAHGGQYPRADVVGFYGRSYRVVNYLLRRGGRQKLMTFMKSRDLRIYGYANYQQLDKDFQDWRFGGYKLNNVSYQYGSPPIVPHCQDCNVGQPRIIRTPPQPQPRPTTQVLQPVPTTTIQNNIVNTLKNDISFLQSLKGEPGRDGTDGTNGKDGEQGPPGNDYVLTEQDKIDIANIIKNDLRIEQPTDETPAGSDGEDDQAPSEPDIPPQQSFGYLYFTLSTEDLPTDGLAQALKEKGAPITIITMSPKETSVNEVPRVYVLHEKREIRGTSNVVTFLSFLSP